MNNAQTPYIQDILSQPEVLRTALQQFDLESVKPLARLIQSGQIDRIVMTGMGSSLAAVYPAWLTLIEHGLNAVVVNAAELVHYAGGLVTPKTLLWMISQSGRSAELMPLIERYPNGKVGAVLAITRDPASPLAAAGNPTLLIHSHEELTVSTVTYTNTLALAQLTALTLCEQTLKSALQNFHKAADTCQEYLAGWESSVSELTDRIGLPKHLVIVGRGSSLSTVQCGPLMIGESSKTPAYGMNAADFRHGPLELASSEITLLVLEGDEKTCALNRRLVADLRRLDTPAYLISSTNDFNPSIKMPSATGLALPIAEILPLQLLSVAFSNQKGIEAGKFLYSGKVTLSE